MAGLEMDVDKNNKEFSAWREAEAEKLPALVARVFALRDRMYSGRGFHWSFEKRLGSIMHSLNDYDDHTFYGEAGWMKQVVCKTALEALVEQVDRAEKSADKWDADQKLQVESEGGESDLTTIQPAE
jgi:hypothetical protein